MARYTIIQVLDMLWNESGDEEDIAGDVFDKNEAYVGESKSSEHVITIVRVLLRMNQR